MNNSLTSFLPRTTGVLIAVALTAIPNLLSAQEDETYFATARIADVESGKELHWEAAIADISAELGAAGRDFNLVFQRIRGDLPGYTIFAPDADYLGLPPVSLDPGLIQRATANMNGNTFMTLAFDPELATNVDDDAPMPQFMTVRVFTVPPNNFPAFETFMSETVAPALRDAEIMSRSARVIMGGSLGSFATFVFTESFPSGVEQALLESMGQRDFDRMNAQGRSILSGVEDIAYRFREDLSYMSD
jgi:hypothetical protein